MADAGVLGFSIDRHTPRSQPPVVAVAGPVRRAKHGRTPIIDGGTPSRTLHPGAWWLWALGLAAAAAHTTNPLILGLIVVVIGLVVATRRDPTEKGRALTLYVWLAVSIVLLRIIMRIIFSGDGPTVLFRLPELKLPGFMVGAQILGPVSAEALLSGFYTGAQLAVMILSIGAANTLANPRRLLAAVPGALYEFGTVLVVSIAVLPQLAESIQRVNRARKLRPPPTKRRGWLRQVFGPVMADSLDRSLALAAAMESRGYGRSSQASIASRRITWLLLLSAAGALCVGVYGIFDSGGGLAFFSGPMLLLGLVLAAAAGYLAGRRVSRSRYRPDKWGLSETVTSVAGLVPAAVVMVLARTDRAMANPPLFPLTWPTLSWLVMAALAVSAWPWRPLVEGVRDDAE